MPTCKCGSEYIKYTTITKMCVPCAIKISREKETRKKVKAFDKETRQRKKNLLTVKDLEKKAQKVFNEFIRLRDHNQPCISCGKPDGKRDAGHFYSVGSTRAMRYYENNCHVQCSAYCNLNLSGNLLNYREGLITRYGEDFLKGLEADKAALNLYEKSFSREYLIQLEQEYKKKVKEIKAKLGMK